MEVLGILAATVGVLKVGSKVSSKLRDIIKTWQNVPAELLALHNELEDLRIVLDEMRSCEKDIEATFQGPLHRVDALRRQIRCAERHLTTLDNLVEELYQLKGSKKKLKWIREKREIGVILRQIRTAREAMSGILVTHSA
jgi:predicted  nucleic acid-binding Zn-ribbon protein